MRELTKSSRENGSGFQFNVINGVLRRALAILTAALWLGLASSLVYRLSGFCLNCSFAKAWQAITNRRTKPLIAILIIASVLTFEANAGTYLETLRVDGDSTDSPLLRQLIEQNISVRKAEDGSFTTSLEEYYGEHVYIDVDLGTVIVELLDRWCFVNRDLKRRAKIIALSYLIWHPEDRDVTVYIHDYKDRATESYFLRVNTSDENAIWEKMDTLTKAAGPDREPLDQVVRN
jgi:hypothetical protein